MSRFPERDIRSVDGAENTCASAEIISTLLPPPEGHAVQVLVNDNAWPCQSAVLAPAAARMLARHLLELADDADLLNMEAEDVEMTCTTCGEPVRRSFGSNRWQHREPSAALACTVTGPVKAKVAAGA